MKKAKNDLLILLGGMAMLGLGLFILSQKVVVSSDFYSLWGLHMHAGLVVIPFVCGIVWLFASGGSLGSKILTWLGIAFIVVSTLLSVSLHLTYMTLFDWMVLVVLIFGGIGLMARVLCAKDSTPTGPNNNAGKSNTDDSSSVDDELEKLKNEYK